MHKPHLTSPLEAATISSAQRSQRAPSPPFRSSVIIILSLHSLQPIALLPFHPFTLLPLSLSLSLSVALCFDICFSLCATFQYTNINIFYSFIYVHCLVLFYAFGSVSPISLLSNTAYPSTCSCIMPHMYSHSAAA